MTEEIFVLELTPQHVGQGGHAAMRVIRKARAFLDEEIVEHEEGSKVAKLSRADRTTDERSSSFRSFLRG